MRVAVRARQLGEAIGLGPSDLGALAWAGSLHDLGKLAVPEKILKKPGKLSDDEWEVVKTHPIVGGQLIMALSPELEPIAQAVRGHHEHWDGSGYPDGLVGPNIPLAARIVALADGYDALTDRRPYRRGPIAANRAREMIMELSGTHFDPALVPAFLDGLRFEDAATCK